VTAKEQLRNRVECLSEDEAREALSLLEAGLGRDSVRPFFERAPLDDEPVSAEEDAAVAEARAQVERGETVSLAQARRELTG
jgi:hypothetical protein